MATHVSVFKLEGKLSPKTLGDVLKKIEGNRGAAYLLVSDGLSEKCLYFSVGAIRLSSMGKRRALRLDDMLASHPRVGADVVERARARQQDTGEPFEEILAAQFNLNDVVRECSTAIVRDEVLDLLIWDGASYEYAEANPPPKIFDPRLEAVKLSFGVPKLLKEAMEGVAKAAHLSAKVSSRTRVIPGSNWTFGAPETAEKEACEAVAAAIPEGGTLFEDVTLHVRRAGIDTLRLCDAVEKMIEERVIDYPRGPKGQPVTGLSKEEEAELAKREVGEIENALDLIINELVARQRLAKGYIAMGDQPRAVFNLKKVGDELLARNKGEDAIDVFRQIVKIVPHDFSARERIAYLYEKMKKIPEAIAEGLDLAKLYKQFGLFNRAKNIFRRVISLEPEQIDHRKELIDLLLKLKENQDAIAEYENLAELYARRQDEGELLGIYRQILAIDPAHKAAKSKTQAIVRRKPGFWVPYVGVVAGFLVLVSITLYVSAEYSAIQAYREARRKAFERADGGDYVGAMAAVDDFLRRYDGSRAAPKARALKVELGELEGERRDRFCREEYARAQQLENGGHMQQALEIYQALKANAGGSSWEGKAAARIKEIEKLSEEAEYLFTQVKRLEADRNFRDAFEKARELVRKFGWTDAAQRLDVKLEVLTVPAGASVTVDGRPVPGRTPCMLQQRAALPFLLTVNMNGFTPETRQIDLKEGVGYPYSLELKRGLRWKATLLGPIEATPLVEDDVVFVGGRDQRVYALDPDGRVRWSRPLGLFADVIARPVRAGTRVVAGDRTGGVTALDAASGEIVWRARVKGGATPIVASNDGVVVVADEEGSLTGFEVAGGKERWRLRVPGGLAALPTPIDGEGVVVVPTGDAFLLVLDLSTGVEKARIPTTAPATAPVAVAGMGYVVATERDLVRFLSREGRQVWQVRSPGAVVAAPLVAGGAAFFGAGSSLMAVEMHDGQPRWPPEGNGKPGVREYRAAIRATPAFRLNRLYVATGDGAVHSLTAETGTLRWTYRTQGEIVAQPVARADTVYVASTDFGVYAIRD